MRVLKFDQQVIEALKALGLEIADDNESADVVGEMRIEICQPNQKQFFLQINLPNGSSLNCDATPSQLLDAAGIETLDEE